MSNFITEILGNEYPKILMVRYEVISSTQEASITAV